ncbi:hypothetical protein B0O99DRAFT_693466 [Bisporella sp. PMI_857]|nr:hypothetical protein B0O99DRAFT_693466 [Bisporella sp. PMI_857]
MDVPPDRSFGKTSCILFLDGCIRSLQLSASTNDDLNEAVAVRFIFPIDDGQVTRSDVLERRFECCEIVEQAVSFVEPLEEVLGFSRHEISSTSIYQVLSKAIGAVQLRSRDPVQFPMLLKMLDAELSNRLSLSWLLFESVPRRRVAWVQGREDFESSGRAYEAAKALGITLVIIDQAGHWLQEEDGPYSHLREAFLPVNIDVDDTFTQRIVDAVHGYPLPIDSLVTISDLRLPGVAKACEILELPTSSAAAYQIAGDKGKTRMLESSGKESFTLSNAEALGAYLEVRDTPLEFPMVVKPCRGWNSDCVSKINSESELAKAVGIASQRHADAPDPSTAVVVEPFIDGPEVDANLVLLNGEIVFFEICDNFPSNGDANNAGPEDTFQETLALLPTALPNDEVILLRDSLHKSIMRQGFSSGIFHCEARVRHSSREYKACEDLLDLEDKGEPPSNEKSTYLHEINARPPGYLETVAVALAYGVDYYALRLLLSIGESENVRIRALSQPFSDGPQFNLAMVIIQQTKAGTMKSKDAVREFLENFPELRDRVPDFKTQKRGGDVLEGRLATALWWIGYISIYSRAGRKDCLRLVNFIRENFSYEVE